MSQDLSTMAKEVLETDVQWAELQSKTEEESEITSLNATYHNSTNKPPTSPQRENNNKNSGGLQVNIEGGEAAQQPSGNSPTSPTSTSPDIQTVLNAFTFPPPKTSTPSHLASLLKPPLPILNRKKKDDCSADGKPNNAPSSTTTSSSSSSSSPTPTTGNVTPGNGSFNERTSANSSPITPVTNNSFNQQQTTTTSDSHTEYSSTASSNTRKMNLSVKTANGDAPPGDAIHTTKSAVGPSTTSPHSTSALPFSASCPQLSFTPTNQMAGLHSTATQAILQQFTGIASLEMIGPPEAKYIVNTGRQHCGAQFTGKDCQTIVINCLSLISNLAERSARHRVCLIEADAIPLLIDAVNETPVHMRSAQLCGQATAGLLHLARETTIALPIVTGHGGIQMVVRSMKEFPTNASLQTVANAALWSFAVTKENKKRIGDCGGVQAIVDSMGNFPGSVDLLIRANAALCNLASSIDTFKRIADSGGMGLILQSMRNFPTNSDLVTSGNVAISNLAVHTAINTQILNAGGVGIVLGSMKTFPTNLPLLCRALAALCSLALNDVAKGAIADQGGLLLIMDAAKAFSGNCMLLTKAMATLWNLSESKPVRKQIKQQGGMDLAKRAMKQFPHNMELLREAMGLLSGKKFSK
eukprot:TRINITY_DN57309_c0_g1_i1.p1 TRINITY_DN57309_c0_g1~~TRINITY_DN57309_c0_g1_i1.p1  ORF type:complete len:640 (+),score=78.25 TRINITY_DN57309_c0_g1_i1:295-2214(+)